MSFIVSNISRCLFLLSAALLMACATSQKHSTAHHLDISLQQNELEQHGLAFITPSTVTGQEEDKQTLAFIYADVMKEVRPEIPLVTLPETLSAINRAGIAEDYKRMYVDYRDTGIFKRDMLAAVGQATGARYLAQMKLSSFSQNSRSRFSVLGLRLFQTKAANIRVFFQVWNSLDGTIVWEGTEEMIMARETSTEKPVSFSVIAEQTARNLISQLP